MLFNSISFLVFILIFFTLWPFLRSHPRSRWIYLILSSFVFYGWWDWRYLGLLIATGLVDFVAALAMERWGRRRRLFLVLSLTANIGTLVVFKYLGFFTGVANDVLRAFGSAAAVPEAALSLPIGVSFYTFQSMSYTIDVYRGRLQPTRSILHFFASLSLFPHLVAGPIIRAERLLPQLAVDRVATETERWEGLRLIAQGYFKKMVLADGVARAVVAGFGDQPFPHSFPFAWTAVTLFAIQIYCDFSGYSDIARGLAKWMGYEFPLNFDHPYRAASLKEFWNRWHISLSSWFRDYVYVPLGGSWKGPARGHLNLWIAMLLSGLWHGAAWNFVTWGAVHAAFLSLERLSSWPQRLTGMCRGWRLPCILVTQLQVWVAWVFFRSSSVSEATTFLSAMADPTSWDLAPLREFGFHALGSGALAVLAFVGVQAWEVLPTKFKNRLPVLLEPFYVAILLTAGVFLRGPETTFIYFRF